MKRFWWRLWVQNGRPRSGWVFKCWKGLKKLFSKTSRWYSNDVSRAELSRLLSHFKLKNMDAFWNTIRRRRRSTQAKTTLLPSSFSNHYRGIMSCNDEVCVSSNDSKISKRVHEVHTVYNSMLALMMWIHLYTTSIVAVLLACTAYHRSI